jgi:hypothetical protein
MTVDAENRLRPVVDDDIFVHMLARLHENCDEGLCWLLPFWLEVQLDHPVKDNRCCRFSPAPSRMTWLYSGSLGVRRGSRGPGSRVPSCYTSRMLFKSLGCRPH